jgi:hypothetical protein
MKILSIIECCCKTSDILEYGTFDVSFSVFSSVTMFYIWTK